MRLCEHYFTDMCVVKFLPRLNVLMYIVDQIKSYFIKTRHTV